jgi:hypothetical protein
MTLLCLVPRNYKKSFGYPLIYLNYYYPIKVAFGKERRDTLIVSVPRGNAKRVAEA